MKEHERIDLMRREIGRRVIGNKDVIEDILICILSSGHILIESPPGLGKTLMARTIAEIMDMAFKRIQCTPDLAPRDIIGDMYSDEELGGRFFGAGPLFTNVLLVDEINRAQPKTQSAFLEAMSERSVTVAGQTHILPEPFFVIATQNPIECEGTYPLPEAQQDRFLLKSHMTYLTPDDEREAIKSSVSSVKVSKLFTPAEVLAIQERIKSEIDVPDGVIDSIIALAAASRARKEVVAGASTRATVLYTKAVKTRAFLMGGRQATTQDVVELAHPILRHRLVMNQDSKNFGFSADHLIDDLIRKTF
ncbi:MAG: AAA family ATPase [Candidatus Altiarchaeota archaeon]